MLPTEAFADAAAFLRLFDLKALVVSNALCSSPALKASNKIRWEDFQGFRFCIVDQLINIFRIPDAPNAEGGAFDSHLVASLTFADENAVNEFVTAAFPNCVFEDLCIIVFRSERLVDAISRIADSVVVRGVLYLSGWSTSLDDTNNLVREFRNVKAVVLSRILSDDDAQATAKLYRGTGVQEIHYYRSGGDLKLTKLALL